MKLLKFILCCLVSPLVVLSQNDEVEITGVVYAFTFPRPESDFLPLKNAEVFLKISDSIIVKQLTDVNGQYNFIVKSVNHIGVLYTKSTNKTYNKEKRQYCFFEDHNKVNIDLSKRKRYIANFQFKQYTDCMGWMPEFFFKKTHTKLILLIPLELLPAC